MLALLLLIIVGAVAWKLVAQGEQFLPGFSRLLTEPRIERGAFSLRMVG